MAGDFIILAFSLIAIMGVCILDGSLAPTLHAFRTNRRRVAIERKNSLLEQLQNETLRLRLKAASAECELRQWSTWFEQQAWAGTPSKKRVSLGTCTADVEMQTDDLGVPSVCDSPLNPSETVSTKGACEEVAPSRKVEDPTGDDVVEMTTSQLEALLDAACSKATNKMETCMMDKLADLMIELSVAREVAKQTLKENDCLQQQVAALSRERDHLHLQVEDLQANLADMFDKSSDSHSCLMDATLGTHDAWATEAHSWSQRRLQGDCQGLCRNDLGLPVDSQGVVEWDLCRELHGDFDRDFREARRLGRFKCVVCREDVSAKPGAYGQVCITDDGEFWEQKDLWSLVGDPPLSLRCVSCHAATVPCKYHQESRCYRGELCAYAHADAHQVATADNNVAHDRVLDVHFESRYFLSPADFVASSSSRCVREQCFFTNDDICNLKAVSWKFLDLIKIFTLK